MAGDIDDAADDRIPDPRPQHTPLWSILSRWLLALEAWLRSHGGTRLRRGLAAFWAVVALAGGVLLFGPVINEPMSLDDITGSASSATDTWIARDFDVDYTVERTDEGRLEADVVETIGAFFPDGVAETGIVRVLPTQYEGHALDPSDLEVTVDGEPATVDRSESSDQLTLTLSPGTSATAPLTGDHEFVLRYRLHDLAYTDVDEATGASVDLLAWDVFGPSWPQAFSGLDVSVTLPAELDDALVRQPRGALAWTLLSAGEWLTPEDPPADAGAPPGAITYGFTNDQNIPPYASARFTMVFESGTFVMPPPTALFIVQSFGPLLPLLFLAVTLLLALAARAVAWSDARGRPWFVAQSEPPRGVSVRAAAQVLRTPRTFELATALDAVSGKGRPDRTARLRAAARAARRTGRLGDRLRATLGYLSASEYGGQLREGLRRIPTGFVRDFFIAAPLALTLVQWGLVRQLSHQEPLAVVWWPAAFVLLSSAISLIVLAVALSARPLTRKGALVRQHLLGIGVYAERTQLLDRATTRDPLLAYAVVASDQGAARGTGRRVLDLIEGELGDDTASRGWRSSDFLSAPRILVRVVAVVLFGASVTAAAVLPNPYPRSLDPVAYSGDLPGTSFNEVRSFEADAVLALDDDRRARLTVTERIVVDFATESTSQVPQVARQWPARADGQELGLSVTSVTIDGTDAPYRASREGDTELMTTMLGEVLTGEHEVVVSYELASPVVAATGARVAEGSDTVDRLRWAALLEDWESSAGWPYDEAPSPVTVSITIPDALAGSALAAGWITEDTDSSDSARLWEETVVPFGRVATDAADDTGSTDSRDEVAGGTRYVLDLRENDNSFPFELRIADLGAMLDYPAGTFAGPDPDALAWQKVRDAFPLALVVALGVLALAIGAVSALVARRRGSRRAPPGFVRDLVWWLGSSTAVSTVWLFVWASSDMPDDWPEFPPLALAALAAVVGAAACWSLTLRERPAAATGRKVPRRIDARRPPRDRVE
ncbi:hypothetical protein SCB71_05250 [Herbiconiux sp. KACC 21604]|uniref:DUF2207 domain-containing protein n=1 Tax=unclassified Herbiconiux TaxID=2618217 RepID=UPI0014920006|nr:DUF2207 domain-containing protein [Herbiconiux sp. SALV-R1]QJU52750.1 hypothetical protein HL652_03230 [Herbiconiux sp. SALV-R1]WPO87653.1 hypothetical protein SCB71_05250 [Herbiconiux sp. KACC 21604]